MSERDVVNVDETTELWIRVVMGDPGSAGQVWNLDIESSPSPERLVRLSSEVGAFIHRGEASIIGAQSEDDFLFGEPVGDAFQGQIHVGMHFVYQRSGSVLKELSPDVVILIYPNRS